jgi:glutathione synthase/RimK-type ligase-like ATP-grasp enzyme
MKLRIATCSKLPEPDVDAAPLAAALATAGYDAALIAWDDPTADWDAPVPTIIRSTWNYALDPVGFEAWVARASRAAPLWNPRAVVLENADKVYLHDLEKRGVPIVPTMIVPKGARLPQLQGRSVIKPAIGAGSLDTRVFEPGDPEAQQHLDHVTRRCKALIQPYVKSVDDYGERSLIWIDGELTHAIRKTPRFSGDAERIDGPFPIGDDERAVALAALASYADQILYGRVDLARDDAGQAMVMELELVEPSLFFAHHPPALDRYIAGLTRRLRSA